MEKPGRNLDQERQSRESRGRLISEQLDPSLCEADRRRGVGSRVFRNGFPREAGSIQDTQHLRGASCDRSVQDRVRDQRIAIIGLGGTGAYVLDLMVKTPVAEIHLLDSDEVDWHNFMRAPGAPTCEEIESLRKARPHKVDYYHSKYASLREGIFAHAVRVDNSIMFAKFLSAHPVDHAFVCIDQRKDCDSPRQDAVYAALSDAGVEFIDSGVSITLEDGAVGGAVTTSAYGVGSHAWKEGIPNARVDGNVPGYRNVQLPEVNALAASLAVMEWRRQTGQYVSNSTSFLHKFRLESGRVKRAR